MAAAGLADRVSVELRDYREIAGTYDAIVSIEMLEAVGAEYFSTFFEACDRALVPGGRMSLQTIAFPDVAYEPQRPRRELDPDVHLPGRPAPVTRRHRTVAPRDATCWSVSVDDIAPHYVRTLQAWRTTFLGRLDAVRAMGFDERFIRMWDYYLAISEAGFATGLSQDLQIVLEKGRGLG